MVSCAPLPHHCAMHDKSDRSAAHRVKSFLALVFALALGACSGLPAHRQEPFRSHLLDPDPVIGSCARLLAAVDDVVDEAGVRDGAAWRVPGHPYLRADRLAAAGRLYLHDDEWFVRLRELDREGRHFELANLPDAARPALNARAERIVAAKPLEETLDVCANQLLDAARRDQRAPAAVVVPGEYSTLKRVVGLYWVSRIAVDRGIRHYQQDTARTFAQPLDDLPVLGRLMRHVPATGEMAMAATGLAPDLARLVARHAPILDIDTHTDHDRFGTPEFDDDRSPEVDIAHPMMFVRVAYTVADGRALTQLVYSIWFPSRPKTSADDLYGGALDGLTWRVTLGPDGRPWVFDTIHNCGCYHQFFPTPRAVARPRLNAIDEWAFVPQSLPDVRPESRVVLRIAAGTHYLQRVSVIDEPVNGSVYAFGADDSLRSLLQRDGSRHSLFGADGIVPGTRRLERLVLWPMGVSEPGSMRQWGRHPTAFVGRRHMDDADLISRYFEFRP